MMNYLQQNFSNSFNIPWPATICVLMLFFSFHAHAANPHKTVKKSPVTTHAVTKTSVKRKRTTQKSASTPHSVSNQKSQTTKTAHTNKTIHTTKTAQTNKHTHTTKAVHANKTAHTNEAAYDDEVTGTNPFAQNNTQNLQITDEMHPKMTMVQNTKLTTAKRQIVAKLMQQIGKPYHYGGSSPQTGFDCSGLVKYAYSNQLKTELPRTADNLFSMSAEQAQKIKKEELHTGDLVFFRTNRSQTHAGHVGIYLGDGQFIQAPRTGQDIQISRLDEDYWQTHYIGARRVLLPSAVR